MTHLQRKTLQSISLWIMSLLYTLAGLNHFWMPGLYLQIMPEYLPFPLALVYLSGLAEIILGVLLLFTSTRRKAAWGIIALLVAIFPANISMLQHADRFSQIPGWVLWLRLPLQGLLIYWAYGFTLGLSQNRASTLSVPDKIRL